MFLWRSSRRPRSRRVCEKSSVIDRNGETELPRHISRKAFLYRWSQLCQDMQRRSKFRSVVIKMFTRGGCISRGRHEHRKGLRKTGQDSVQSTSLIRRCMLKHDLFCASEFDRTTKSNEHTQFGMRQPDDVLKRASSKPPFGSK